MDKILSDFINTLENVLSNKKNLSSVELELSKISVDFKNLPNKIITDDVALSNKISKIEDLILKIEKKFEKNSKLLDEFKYFIEQKK